MFRGLVILPYILNTVGWICLIIGLNVFIFQIHDRDIQHSTIINRGFEGKPKAYRVHLFQQQINLLNIVIWQKLKQT